MKSYDMQFTCYDLHAVFVKSIQIPFFYFLFPSEEGCTLSWFGGILHNLVYIIFTLIKCFFGRSLNPIANYHEKYFRFIYQWTLYGFHTKTHLLTSFIVCVWSFIFMKVLFFIYLITLLCSLFFVKLLMFP